MNSTTCHGQSPTTQPVNDPELYTDEDLYPPDQASDLGASYYYCTPGPGHSVYDAQRPGTSRPGRVFFPSRGAS